MRQAGYGIFLSMDMTDTSLAPENLQVQAQLLAEDIRQRIQKEQGYIDWLNRYRCLLPSGTGLHLPGAFGIGSRPLLPDGDFICLSSADAETKVIVRAYNDRKQRLGLWGKIVAYVSGDDARHAQLQSLVTLDAILTQVSRQLRAADVSSASTDSSGGLPPVSLAPLVATTAALPAPSVPASASTAPTRPLPMGDYLKQALDNALQQAIYNLPWRHKLLSPLRSLQTFWQSFTTTPGQTLSSASPVMFRVPFVPTFGGRPAQPRAYRAGRHVRYIMAPQPSPSMLTTSSSEISSPSSSSSSSSLPLPPPAPAVPLALFDGIAETLDQALKGLAVYGHRARYGDRRDNRSFTSALRDLQQPTSAASTSSPSPSLNDLWREDINKVGIPHTSASASRSGLYPLSAEAYRWLGLNPHKTDCRLTWHRLLLHYGRLQQGIQDLRNALDAEPLDEAVMTQASTHLANVLWEGAVLSHQQNALLFKHHFQLIHKLRALCSHSAHPALDELTSTLDSLSREVKMTAKQAPGRRNKHLSVYQITLQPDEASANWRLQHQSTVSFLHHDYQQQHGAIRKLIRYIDAPGAKEIATNRLRELSLSLDGPLRSAMLTASTVVEAQHSRENYTHAVRALETLLTELQQAHPEALYRATQQLVERWSSTCASFSSSSASSSSSGHAGETPLEKGIRGFMDIKPELFPLINQYLEKHPDSPLARYSPSFENVPNDVILKGLPKLMRLTHDETDKEIQQLIGWHRACAHNFKLIVRHTARTEQAEARAKINRGITRVEDTLSQAKKKSGEHRDEMTSAVSEAEHMHATALRLREDASTLGIDTSALPLEALKQRCFGAEQACQAAIARREAADKQVKGLWAQKEVIRAQLRALQVAEEGKGPDELRESLPAYEALGQALLTAILETIPAYHQRSVARGEVLQRHREASAVYQEAATIYQHLIDEARAEQARRQRELEDNARQERERAEQERERAEQVEARARINQNIAGAEGALSQATERSDEHRNEMASAVSEVERMHATVLRLREEAPTFGIDTSALPLEALMQRCLSAEQACQAAIARCETADKQARDLWAQKKAIWTQLWALQAAEEGKGPDELRESLPAYEALGQALLAAILETTRAHQERSAAHGEALQPHCEATEVYQEAATIYQHLIDEARAAQAQRQRELEDNARQERERAEQYRAQAEEDRRRTEQYRRQIEEDRRRTEQYRQQIEEHRRRTEQYQTQAEQLAADEAEQEVEVLRARVAALEEALREQEQSDIGAEQGVHKAPQDSSHHEASTQSCSSEGSDIDSNQILSSIPPGSPLSRPPSPSTSSSSLFSADPSFRHRYREYNSTLQVDSEPHQPLDILPGATSPSDISSSRAESPVAENATDRYATPDGP